MPVLTHNIFLATLFGGIITGAGLGLVSVAMLQLVGQQSFHKLLINTSKFP